STNVAHVFYRLINVLNVPRWSEAEGSKIASKRIDFHVGKIRKGGGVHKVRPVQPGKRQPEVVNYAAADRPRVRENVLPGVVGLQTGKLVLRLNWVHLWQALPVIKNTRADLVLPQVQIAVDCKIVFSGPARSNSSERADWNVLCGATV